MSIGDVGINGRTRRGAANYLGNTHGSLIEIDGNYYVFYHRQTNRHQFSRQACAERIEFTDGKFRQAELTSCGLNGKPLKGKGTYEARIACNLYSCEGAYCYGVIKRPKRMHPYFTQSGKDREDNPDQYIANFRNGATAVFRYFDIDELSNISVTVKGRADGMMTVRNSPDGQAVARIFISPTSSPTEFTGKWTGNGGIQSLCFTYEGKGAFDFINFTLE